MKRLLYLSIVLIILLFGFYFFHKTQVKITNYPSSGADIIAFGDSLVEGVGSSSGGFVKMLSRDLGLPIVNLGVSGNTTADALARVSQIREYKPKLVIVLLGGNDFLRKVPVETTFNNLDKIIVEIEKTGAVVLLVGIEGHLITSGHEKYFEALRDKRGTAYVPDILDDILGDPKLMSDELHPNDLGYRIMADRIKPILKESL